MSLTRPAALVSCALIAGCAGRPVPPVETAEPNGGYQVVHGWPVLPANTMLDEVSAVAVDSRDRVYVLTRGNRKWPDSDLLDTTPIHPPTVTVFDGRSGRMLSQWPGDRFALPHSITIDRNDDVWVTDVAWHQVLKFSPDGAPLLTLGQRGVPGTDSLHFNRPSDVAASADGSVYVSDGYGNDRIVRFAADGRWLGAWGRKGNGAGELDLPHALAVDRRGRVFVVDRGAFYAADFSGRRVQKFVRTGMRR